jgi:hypothetical protein
MARIALIALFAGLSTTHAAEGVVVKGELSWTSSGIARVTECGSKRVLEFGTMASSPYFRFRRQYDELSPNGQMPVLVEVQGVLGRSSTSPTQVIEHPRVLGLTKGRCEKPGA